MNTGALRTWIENLDCPIYFVDEYHEPTFTFGSPGQFLLINAEWAKDHLDQETLVLLAGRRMIQK